MGYDENRRGGGHTRKRNEVKERRRRGKERMLKARTDHVKGGGAGGKG